MKLTLKVRDGNLSPRVQKHLEQRIESLEKRLPEKTSQVATLTVVIDAIPKKKLTTIGVRLTLPGRIVRAAEEGGDQVSALSKVFNELERQLNRVRKRRSRLVTPEKIEALPPLLQSQDIVAVHQFLEHELSLMAAEGEVELSENSPEDLLNDILVSALEKWDSKPERVSTRSYLFRLATDRLEEERKRLAEESVEEVPLEKQQPRVPPTRKVAGTGSGYYDFWQPDDFMSGGDLVPSVSGDPFETLAAQEDLRIFRKSLATLPPLCRQAILLRELEAFEPVEIAMIQNRNEEKVIRDLKEGYQFLKSMGLRKGE